MMFGLIERAQLKMHDKNLQFAANFESDKIGSNAVIKQALDSAISRLYSVLKIDRSVSFLEAIKVVPLQNCEELADIFMHTASSYTQAGNRLADYYAFDILAGVFRARVIAFRKPGLARKAEDYINSACRLIAVHLPVGPEKSPPQGLDNNFEEVVRCAKLMNLEITSYGKIVAQVSLETGYAPAETASYLALSTFARDVKEMGFEVTKMIESSIRAVAMLECLKNFKDRGMMRPEVWENDSRAFGKIGIPSPETEQWISQVLADPLAGTQRVGSFIE